MNVQDAEFFKELLSMFRIETEEHIQVMTSNLQQLEKDPSSQKRTEVLEVIFRSAHSLKGAARTVGLVDIEPICLSLESLFSSMRQRDFSLSEEMFSMLYTVIKNLGELIASIDETGKLTGDKSEITRLLDNINSNIFHEKE
jgi:two-component system chemotaxis sensor kinase CheA